MKIAVIGGSGHYGYALEAIRIRRGLSLDCVAPGPGQDDVRGVIRALGEMGIKPRVYPSADALLRLERPQVAVVNPWFCDISAVSYKCMQMGAHVYCEKPLATGFADLKQTMECARQSRRELAGMFDLRFTPWFLAVSQAVAEDRIGQIRMINGRKSYRMGQRSALYRTRDFYGGMFPWVGIHAIDWALALGGPCKRISAFQSAGCNRGHEELETVACAVMELSSGAIATVTADYFRPDGSSRHDDDRLLVTGTKGTLEAVNGRVTLENHTGRYALSLPAAGNSFLTFLDALGTENARVMQRDALYSSYISLSARQAADEGRVIATEEEYAK